MLILPGTTKTGKIKDTTLEGKAHYNAETNTLTLDNVITDEPIIFRGSITIILIGENTVTGINHMLFPTGSNEDLLIIEGNGSLTVVGVTKINRLLVKECTLYIKYCTRILQIDVLKAVKANIIIESPIPFSSIYDINLQGCSIVYQLPQNNYITNYKELLIVQKDRKMITKDNKNRRMYQNPDFVNKVGKAHGFKLLSETIKFMELNENKLASLYKKQLKGEVKLTNEDIRKATMQTNNKSANVLFYICLFIVVLLCLCLLISINYGKIL